MTIPESSAANGSGRIIYRQRDLQALLGLSRNAIERLMAEEVHAWLDKRKAERDVRERPERPCA